jgi:hypothetical protein
MRTFDVILDTVAETHPVADIVNTLGSVEPSSLERISPALRSDVSHAFSTASVEGSPSVACGGLANSGFCAEHVVRCRDHSCQDARCSLCCHGAAG